jgi:transcriptional regulator with XRE-family HTH domain
MDDPQNNPKAFLGEELRRARVAAGFSSQEALAAKLGYDRSVIAKAETGDRPPTPDVAAALQAELFASSDGAPDVLNMNGVEDVTAESRSLVRRATIVFDLVRGDALPRTASRALILEAAEQWKTR